VSTVASTTYAPEARAASAYADLAAEDRYQTAIRLSVMGFEPGVEGVVVASGDDELVAAASAVLAAAYGGPLLLTPADSLDPRVVQELWRLGPRRVFIVGTDPSVARAMAKASLGRSGSERLVMVCGADSDDTVLLVAEQIGQKSDVDGVLLYSERYARETVGPVVSASALAAAKGWPMMFVPDSGSMSEETYAVVEHLSPETVLRVQTTVDLEEGTQVASLEGRDRYELGARLAEYASGVGLSYDHTVVLSGSAGSAELGLAVGSYLAPAEGIGILSAADGVPAETIALVSGVTGALGEVEFCGLLAQGREQFTVLIQAGGIPAGFASTVLKQNSKGGDVAWLEDKLSDLSYRPGPVDGVFDRRTRQAVIAFQKWEGLKRDGVVGSQVWWRLLEAERPTPAYAEEGVAKAPDGRWIEIDKKRQVLLYCVDGVVERTIAVSTGNPSVGVATPSGLMWVRRENSYERVRYKPLYLSNTTVLAIHGYTSVPTYPASHGCIRMTWSDMDEFHDLIPVGTPVLVY